MDIIIGKKYTCECKNVVSIFIDIEDPRSGLFYTLVEFAGESNLTEATYSKDGELVTIFGATRTLSGPEMRITGEYNMMQFVDKTHPNLVVVCQHKRFANMAFSNNPEHAKWCCTECGKNKVDCDTPLYVDNMFGEFSQCD